MNEENLLRFGNELEMSGVIFANGKEAHLVLFPEANIDVVDHPKKKIHIMNTSGWVELLNQLDTLQVVGLNKVILRKSQRQIEQGVTWNVFRRDNYTCQYCGKNDVPLTVDHIILWEKDGATAEDNLVSACRKCNKTRGNMEFDEWLDGEYFTKAHTKGFGHEGIIHLDFLEEMGEKAKKVPLRPTPRSR